MDITGRKLFVKALQEEGVDTIFAYPGGMVTDIVDELYKQDSIHVVLPMARAGIDLRGRRICKSDRAWGVCLVTSGPGATNTDYRHCGCALSDSIPLVILLGRCHRV